MKKGFRERIKECHVTTDHLKALIGGEPIVAEVEEVEDESAQAGVAEADDGEEAQPGSVVFRMDKLLDTITKVNANLESFHLTGLKAKANEKFEERLAKLEAERTAIKIRIDGNA